MKRSLKRVDNDHLFPEAFYGPQDVSEMEKWVLHTRWTGPNGEIQFHPNGVVAGPQLNGEASWRVVTGRKLEITWPKATEATSFECDSTWSQMSVPDDDKQAYRILAAPSSPATFSIEKKEFDRLIPNWFGSINF